jgi:hypothetical protein
LPILPAAETAGCDDRLRPFGKHEFLGAAYRTHETQEAQDAASLFVQLVREELVIGWE